MKSNKQRRAQILQARAAKRRARTIRLRTSHPAIAAADTAPVDHARLLPTNSYGGPAWAMRGYYQDTPFTCRDCAVQCTWTAARQKWWYEVARGHPETIAVRCKACRMKERERKAAARAASAAGRARKQEKTA